MWIVQAKSIYSNPQGGFDNRISRTLTPFTVKRGFFPNRPRLYRQNGHFTHISRIFARKLRDECEIDARWPPIAVIILLKTLYHKKADLSNPNVFRIAIGKIKNEKEDTIMTREEKIVKLEKMLRKAPEVLTPMQASRCSPLGKNRIYGLIKSKELRSFIYRGGYIIAKADLIEYLADHSDDSKAHGIAIQNDMNGWWVWTNREKK